VRVPDRSDAGRCPRCGKYRYVSKHNAKREAARFDPTLSAYHCDGYWHLGHLSIHVKAGKADRRDLRARRTG